MENLEHCWDSFNTDIFMDREYHITKYNCAHFVADVWLAMFNQDISYNLGGFISNVKTVPTQTQLHIFKRLKAPKNPCIVMLRNSPSDIHTGIYLRDKLLHIGESGVRFEPMYFSKINYKRIAYYDVK